jgi:hypothetical protein
MIEGSTVGYDMTSGEKKEESRVLDVKKKYKYETRYEEAKKLGQLSIIFSFFL